jgi:urea carboxylase
MPEAGQVLPAELYPALETVRQVRVIYGPHGAPEYFTSAYMETFFATDWEVHFNSSRTGVRLIGPKPEWVRDSGGEAGLHPSNIHDNPYAIGAVDFTGDMPVILGPDGPSLGGFVCPVTVIEADLWQIGQLNRATRSASCGGREHGTPHRPGRTRRYRPPATAAGGLVAGTAGLAHRAGPGPGRTAPGGAPPAMPTCCWKSAPGLDLVLRFRVHALIAALKNRPARRDRPDAGHPLAAGALPAGSAALPSAAGDHRRNGTPSVPAKPDGFVAHRAPAAVLGRSGLPARHREIHDHGARMRPGAQQWSSSAASTISRTSAQCATVFDASYLVMGLGDVYLGAPVATPLDPRHRLVTTKYNPARTWTAENSVGIGGAYLCVYGMEGPGGYQFVGRTLQMWNRYREVAAFRGKPWLLRFFDQIRFYPVTAEECSHPPRLSAGALRGRHRGDAAEPGGLPGFPAARSRGHRRLPPAPAGGLRCRTPALDRQRPGQLRGEESSAIVQEHQPLQAGQRRGCTDCRQPLAGQGQPRPACGAGSC